MRRVLRTRSITRWFHKTKKHLDGSPIIVSSDSNSDIDRNLQSTLRRRSIRVQNMKQNIGVAEQREDSDIDSDFQTPPTRRMLDINKAVQQQKHNLKSTSHKRQKIEKAKGKRKLFEEDESNTCSTKDATDSNAAARRTNGSKKSQKTKAGTEQAESSKRARKRSKKSVKPKRVYRNYLLTRTPPQIFTDMMRCLSEEQIKWVTDTGFGSLLPFNLKKFPHKLCYNIIWFFDYDNCNLILGDKEVPIRESDVHEVLALPQGPRKIKVMTNIDDIETEWAKQFGGTRKPSKITAKKLYETIEKSRVVDTTFKQNFMIMMSNFMIESLANSYVSRSILGFTGDLDRCYEYNWCALVMQSLIKSSEPWLNAPNTRHYTGPSPFMLYFYLDRVRHFESSVPRSIPTYLSWTTTAVNDVQVYVRANNCFGKGTILKSLREPDTHNNTHSKENVSDQIQRDVEEVLPRVTQEENVNRDERTNSSTRVQHEEAVSEDFVIFPLELIPDLLPETEKHDEQADQFHGRTESIADQSDNVLHPSQQVQQQDQCPVRGMQPFAGGSHNQFLSEQHNSVQQQLKSHRRNDECESSGLRPPFQHQQEKRHARTDQYESSGLLPPVQHQQADQFHGRTEIAADLSDNVLHRSQQVQQEDQSPVRVMQPFAGGSQNQFLSEQHNSVQQQENIEYMAGDNLNENMDCAVDTDDLLEEEGFLQCLEKDIDEFERAQTKCRTNLMLARALFDTNAKVKQLENRFAELHKINQTSTTPKTSSDAPSSTSNAHVPEFDGANRTEMDCSKMDHVSISKDISPFSKWLNRDSSFSAFAENSSRRLEGDFEKVAQEENQIVLHIPENDNIKNRLRKDLKAAQNIRSPFYKRVTTIFDTRFKTEEDEVWQWLHKENDEPGQIVFQWSQFTCMRKQLQSLACKDVVSKVVDVWTCLLNNLEEMRSIDSPYRFFCTINTTANSLTKTRQKSTQVKYTNFANNMGQILQEYDVSLDDVDMVFFPLQDHDHYYIVCYNLKNPAFEIIDNRAPQAVDINIYEGLPNSLHNNFVRYLYQIKHRKATQIQYLSPNIIRMSWQTKYNRSDSAIFTMRHMDAYMGNATPRWSVSLPVEDGQQTRYLQRLRIVYCHRIITSSLNIWRDIILNEAKGISSTGQGRNNIGRSLV